MSGTHTVANAYLHSVNRGDAAAYLALFADEATVDDAGRQFRGRAAIKDWSESEIFAAKVSLAPLDQQEAEGESLITTIVDGNFDRTGLPNPVIIRHTLDHAHGRIRSLTCRLVTDSNHD